MDGWRLAGSVACGIVVLSGCTRDPRPLPEVPESPPPASSSGTGSDSLAAVAQDWAYSGASGPDHWAELRPEWKSCAGTDQSPVDLPLDVLVPGAKPADAAKQPGSPAPAPAAPATPSPPDLAAAFVTAQLVPQFSPLPLEASSDGRLVELAGARAQGLSVDGSLATLERLEVHAPAEHKLGGTHPDLELVLVLSHPDKGNIALSLLFRKGAASADLEPLLGLPAEPTYAKKLLSGTLALSTLVPKEAQLLVYSGSETRPPCAAGVTRLVVAQVGELSEEQLTKLRALLPGASNRSVLPLGERKVHVASLSAKGTADPKKPAPR